MPRGWAGVFVALLIVMAPSGSAVAHHSVAGQFDPSKSISVTGVVSRVEWVNPHIYVYVDVTDDTGSVETWAMETVTPTMARRAGLTAERLWGDGKPVTIDAIPARDESRRLGYVTKFSFADGRFVQMSVNP